MDIDTAGFTFDIFVPIGVAKIETVAVILLQQMDLAGREFERLRPEELGKRDFPVVVLVEILEELIDEDTSRLDLRDHVIVQPEQLLVLGESLRRSHALLRWLEDL